MLRPLAFSSLFLVLLYILYSQTIMPRTKLATPLPWASPLSGWVARTTPHPSPDNFNPNRSDLDLVVLRNAQKDVDGFTLALFSPNIGVDYLGRVLILSQSDYDGIVALGKETPSLPQTGRFRNTWVVDQPRTGMPIERILLPRLADDVGSASGAGQIPVGYEADYIETSVQGFEKGKRELRFPIDGSKELPDALYELVGVVLEARATEGEKDEGMLGRVKAVLGDVYGGSL